MPESLLFGLLDQPSRKVSFTYGEVRPLVPDLYSRVRRWGEKHGHRDGWLYPSTLERKRFLRQPDGSEVEVEWGANEPQSELWRAAPTHELIWAHPSHGDDERYLPAIVINALGWAYGNRVQFADWRFDGRARWQCSPSFGLRVLQVRYFLERVVATALSLSGQQVGLLGALVLHNRVPMYLWDWERHHWQYVVFDACWRLLQHRGLVPPGNVGGHGKRIATACDHLGIPRIPAVESRIVSQRNDLAHQGLWCEGLPGYGGTKEAHYDYFRVRKLVDRVLLHIFGIECGLRTRSWDVHGMVAETMDMAPTVPSDLTEAD